MYSLITATENENINKELKKTQMYNVLFSDIVYQEALLEIIKTKDIDKVLVYENLSGEREKRDFFKQLTDIKKNGEIIVIVDKINNKTKEYFDNFKITKLLDSRNITLENINKIINEESEKNIVKTATENTRKEDVVERIDFNKKIIAINGNNGSGKTTFAINLAIALAKNTNKKVLLMDMDTVNANIEIFLDIPKLNNKANINIDEDKQCVLNYITECIQKNTLDFDVFSNAVIQYNKYKNLNIITGNTSMFVCQNILCEKYYNIILEKANSIYDYIIIDTNSNLFLDATKWAMQKSDITYFVLEGTYRDLKNLKNSLVIFSKSWDILIDKIKLILNKTTNFSLTKDNIKNISDVDVLCEFEYSQDYIKVLNNGIPIILYNKTILKKYEKIIGISETKKNLFQIVGGKIIDNKSIKNK